MLILREHNSLLHYILTVDGFRLILTLFLFIARAFISGAFQAAYVYTPEVYYTALVTFIAKL